jgi:hypothetical protein
VDSTDRGLSINVENAKLIGQTMVVLVEKAKNALELRKLENRKRAKRQAEIEARKKQEQQELAYRLYRQKEDAAILLQRMVGGRRDCTSRPLQIVDRLPPIFLHRSVGVWRGSTCDGGERSVARSWQIKQQRKGTMRRA